MNLRLQNPFIRLIFHFVLLLWTASVLYPLLWSLLDSLKNNKQFLLHAPWSLPDFPLLWSNYSYVWSRYHLNTYFLNSVIVTTGATVLGLLLSSMTAYVLARYKFRFSGTLYTLYIASMMIPFALALIPLFFLLNRFQLVNTQLGLILVYASQLLAFGIFVLVGFYKSLPKELEEAAVMDGASYYGTYFKVMLPLSRPGMVTVLIVNVLNVWNEYFLGVVLTNDPAHYTLPVGIAVLQTEMQYRVEWGPLFAALMFTTVPVLLVYIFFQRQIASGMTAGAVK